MPINHADGHTSAGRSRAGLIALLALGVGLIAAPVVFGMFSRAPQGELMLADFKPLMTSESLDGFVDSIATIDAGIREVNAKAPATLGPLAESVPSYTALQRDWPTIHHDMSTLLSQIKANKPNYDAIAALPPFGLFPWFFVVPGVVLITLSWLGLRRGPSSPLRLAFVVLGIGLIAAPFAFQMFDRAPKGAEMMSAFTTIETDDNVLRIQGYLSTMAAGQGAIRLDIVPALARHGVDTVIEFPATTRLDAEWVSILNTMTPMIGAMADNVTRYQALTALPPFGLFPWFFVIPGGLIALVAIAGIRPRTTEGQS